MNGQGFIDEGEIKRIQEFLRNKVKMPKATGQDLNRKNSSTTSGELKIFPIRFRFLMDDLGVSTQTEGSLSDMNRKPGDRNPSPVKKVKALKLTSSMTSNDRCVYQKTTKISNPLPISAKLNPKQLAALKQQYAENNSRENRDRDSRGRTKQQQEGGRGSLLRSNTVKRDEKSAEQKEENQKRQKMLARAKSLCDLNRKFHGYSPTGISYDSDSNLSASSVSTPTKFLLPVHLPSSSGPFSVHFRFISGHSFVNF